MSLADVSYRFSLITWPHSLIHTHFILCPKCFLTFMHTHWYIYIWSNLRFSVLLSETSACGLEERGCEPSNFRLVRNLFYCLESRESNPQQWQQNCQGEINSPVSQRLQLRAYIFQADTHTDGQQYYQVYLSHAICYILHLCRKMVSINLLIFLPTLVLQGF